MFSVQTEFLFLHLSKQTRQKGEMHQTLKQNF